MKHVRANFIHHKQTAKSSHEQKKIPLLSFPPTQFSCEFQKKKSQEFWKLGFAALFTFFIRKQTLKQMGSPPYHGGTVCVSQWSIELRRLKSCTPGLRAETSRQRVTPWSSRLGKRPYHTKTLTVTETRSVAISFPEAAILLVSDGDRDFSGAWQKGPLGTRLETLIMRQHSLRVLVRQRGGFLRLLARWDVMMIVIKLWSKGHTYTIPTLGQYLTHAPSHITQAVAAMDSCFTFIRPYQLVRPLYGHLSCVQRPFTTEPSAKHFLKRQLRRHI